MVNNYYAPQWHHGKEVKVLWTAAVADQIENEHGVTRGTRTTTEERSELSLKKQCRGS